MISSTRNGFPSVEEEEEGSPVETVCSTEEALRALIEKDPSPVSPPPEINRLSVKSDQVTNQLASVLGKPEAREAITEPGPGHPLPFSPPSIESITAPLQNTEPGIDFFTTCQRIEELYEGTIKLMIETAGYIRTMVHLVDELRNNQHNHPPGLAALQNDVGGILDPAEYFKPLPTLPVDPVAPAQPLDEELYEGTVKLVVEAACYAPTMLHFVTQLTKNQNFRLLRLASQQRRGGMDVWLRIPMPMTLKSTLLQMKGVSWVAAPDVVDPDSNERQLQVSLG